MRHDSSRAVLDVGRRTRAVSSALRRALDHRDKGCRFPGCGLRLCDAHHLEHWADGGATKLDNLVLLCRRHHRAVHEEGFTVRLVAGGEMAFHRSDGRLLPVAPALPVVHVDPMETIAASLVRRGITVDAEAGMPSWEGGAVDYGWAIEHLRPLAGR